MILKKEGLDKLIREALGGAGSGIGGSGQGVGSEIDIKTDITGSAEKKAKKKSGSSKKRSTLKRKSSSSFTGDPTGRNADTKDTTWTKMSSTTPDSKTLKKNVWVGVDNGGIYLKSNPDKFTHIIKTFTDQWVAKGSDNQSVSLPAPGTWIKVANNGSTGHFKVHYGNLESSNRLLKESISTRWEKIAGIAGLK
jgi:hypothetical protein